MEDFEDYDANSIDEIRYQEMSFAQAREIITNSFAWLGSRTAESVAEYLTDGSIYRR